MLEGTIVNVRVMEREDLPLLTEWINDPEFSGKFEPLEQSSRNEVEKWYNNLRPNEKWFIIEKKDGNRIGYIMHTLEERHFTIGYTIVPGERNKGYCTEAVAIMVDYLFLSTSTVRVQARTNLKNEASHKVLEKAGFTKEGVVRKSFFARGEWHDTILSSILREEWKEPKILKV